jgi:GTP-binding protein Era
MHPAAEGPAPPPYRCGYVAIAGRPNVGKSTLLNRLVGEKLSITSRKAQTTRHRVTGIRTTPTAQSIFVDTPGIQRRHASRLNARMNRTAREALAGVDAIVVVLEAGRTTAADREVVGLVPAGAPAVAALNKVDRLRERDALLPQMRELASAFPFAAIVPVSAENGRGLDALAREVEALLPERPAVHDAEEITDRDERFLAAELIREKVFRLLGEEVPYATAVVIDRFAVEAGLRRIHATVYVDRDNQKAIVIGRGGAQMKEIATWARTDMQQLFGGPVFLDVRVRVKRGWADDEAALTRLGY